MITLSNYFLMMSKPNFFVSLWFLSFWCKRIENSLQLNSELWDTGNPWYNWQVKIKLFLKNLKKTFKAHLIIPFSKKHLQSSHTVITTKIAYLEMSLCHHLDGNVSFCFYLVSRHKIIADIHHTDKIYREQLRNVLRHT